MIDAQPGDGWIVPAAVAWALFEDARAADQAMAAAEPLWNPRANGHGHPFRADGNGTPGTGGNGSAGRGPHDGRRADNGAPQGNPWLRAARDGLADPVLARSSQQCFEAADAALGRAGAPADIRRRVAEFADRYVLRRRCPADDQLEGMQ